MSDCSNVSSTNFTSPLAKDSILQFPPNKHNALVNRPILYNPVVVVALTASSLQTDRQEALTAGCNDFLTKVVLALVYFELQLTS